MMWDQGTKTDAQGKKKLGGLALAHWSQNIFIIDPLYMGGTPFVFT